MKCIVYKGSRKPDAYLFVPCEENLSLVPNSLLALMGTLQTAMTLELTNDSALAQTSGKQVLKQLKEQGFYFQLPSTIPELSVD